MRFSQIIAFEKHLQSASLLELPEVYFIISQDAEDRKEGLSFLFEALLKDQMNHSSFKQFEGDKLESKELFDELNTYSFFVKKRAVLIRDADLIPKQVQSALIAYLNAPHPDVTLVFSAKSFSKQSSFYKKVEKVGVIYHQEEEKPWIRKQHLLQRLDAYARKAGKRLDARAGQWMIEQVGLDLSLLYQELEKAICYSGGKELITLDFILPVTEKGTQATIWKLGDAIFLGESLQAYNFLKELLSQTETWVGILRSLRLQFQTAFEMACLIFQGASRQVLSQSYPQFRGSFLDKKLELIKLYGFERLRQGLIEIDEVETEIKKSSLSPIHFLENLTLRLSCS